MRIGVTEITNWLARPQEESSLQERGGEPAYGYNQDFDLSQERYIDRATLSGENLFRNSGSNAVRVDRRS